MGNSTSSSSIQPYLYNKENQEQFIISMLSTSPSFSDSLKNSVIVQSQALSVNYFCFFTCGSNRNLKFWQLRSFFVISLQVKKPPINQFHAIVHTYNDAKFLSIHIDKVAYANMISFMDSAPASLSREAYITRILNLYRNNDPLLYSKVYPIYRIRFAQPQLDIAEPTLLGRSAHRYAQDESFSTAVTDHPSRLEVNSDYLEALSTNEAGSSLINSKNTIKERNQTKSSNKLIPDLKTRQFDVWSSVANDTTTFLDNDSELNPDQPKASDNALNHQANYASDFQNSSFFNPLSEPESVDDEGLSTVLNSGYSQYDSPATKQGKYSSSLQTISEPGSYESSVSQTFKEARKMKSKVRLHKHHNLDNEDSDEDNQNDIQMPSSSTVTVSESFFSPSTTMNSESSGTRKKSKKRRGNNSNEEEDDGDNYSISYSERSVASRASKIHIFTDSNEDSINNRKSGSNRRRSKSRNIGRDSSSVAPSFVSEAVMSSTTGKPSRKKRNVGTEIDLHHDVGFTTSDTTKNSYQYEKDETNSSSFSNRKSNRSKGAKSRRKQDDYVDDESLNRIKNRKKDISVDLSQSQSETVIESD